MMPGKGPRPLPGCRMSDDRDIDTIAQAVDVLHFGVQ